EQIQLDPSSPMGYNFRARLYFQQGNFAAALVDHKKASELDQENPNTHCKLAWIWATCPNAKFRDGHRAVQAASRACVLTDWKKADCFDVLAAALAEAGDFES